ncbi:hypothetical protein [Dulcicalothrix desertica]|nr:hypothetical protein [Dulcicalothrix desertica]
MKILNHPSHLAFRVSLSILIFCAIILISQSQSISSPPSTQNQIPTIAWQNTRMPDWNQITFSKMPAISESASFQAPSDTTQKLGYDPSRNWNAGQTPDSFTMLGDFQDSFELQKFSLNDISQIVNSNLNKVTLDSFGIMKKQNLSSLVQAIPDLKTITIAQVKPIYDLLAQDLSSYFNANQTIGNLLQQSPHLGKLNFTQLDLSAYNIDSIPELQITPLGTFDKWQGVYIDEIPGLNNVSFSQFPNPINSVGAEVGIIDIAFGTDEQLRNRTISGSEQEGFAVQCSKDCAHIELSGSDTVSGKAWVSGKYQLVKGGSGILGSVNGGKEPTGRNLFGSAFKVAVWDVSEVDGMMSQALFFRACMRNSFIDLGCTPYFIGPVPFMTYREKDPIFLGLNTVGAENSTSTPTGLKSNGFTFNQAPIVSSSSVSNLLQAVKGNCSKQHSSGANTDALSTALSGTESNYNSVGNYLCDSESNCGRPLGAMQLMSERPDVRRIIASKSGGTEFLGKLDKGEKVTGEEMTQYFSPSEQQTLIASDVNELLDKSEKQIDPTTGKAFTGERLVERAGQMYFAGTGIPVDTTVSDVSEESSVREYGNNVASQYSKSLQTMGCT